jgi:hypothetical protein
MYECDATHATLNALQNTNNKLVQGAEPITYKKALFIILADKAHDMIDLCIIMHSCIWLYGIVTCSLTESFV